MKRILAAILMLSFALPLCAAAFPMRISAKDAPAADAEVNFAKGIVWNKTVGGPKASLTDDGVIMSNINNPWDSAGCDILPALKAALGDGEYVTVKLSFELEARMKAGKEKTSVNLRPLLRGSGSSSAPSDAAWNDEYTASLHGDAPLFFRQGGNIMMYFANGCPQLHHGDPVTYETVVTLTRNQILCPILSEWMLCVDSIDPTAVINTVEMRNLSIRVVAEPSYGDDVWDGELPQPKDTYTTEVWSPAEIILHSTVDYANPYTDTEIDAVFTHTDGTQITLPGFWMGDVVWAVRFSPTKEGEWSYKITCKDTGNTGLNTAGKVIATAAEKDTELAKHGFVTTVKDQRYYQYADGTPFFWLGDTNWQAPTQLSTTVCNYPGCDCGSQFKHIVNNRLEKGFTVFQTYFVPEGGNGEPGLWLGMGHKKPDVRLFNEKIDGMFEYLGEQGLVIALGLGCHSSTMSAMNLEDFLRFTRYIVARYSCYSVVWITGQEITMKDPSATPGYTAFDCYMEAAALVEKLDGYKHPNSAHMWPMYATDESAVRLDKSDWHDSWTVQGGHGNAWSGNVGHIQSKDFYKSYYTANGSGFHKPFIESESNYEDINCGPFTGYDANRIGAWRAMLCGSAGFTYGVTGIWASSFSTSGFTGWYGATTSYSYDPWYVGLDKPGSFEVSYMKDFFLDIGPWYELIPRFDDRNYSRMLNREEYLLASTEDASLVVGYFYHVSATRSPGELKHLDNSKTYDTYWFDPRTGRYIPIEKGIRVTDGSYDLPMLPDDRDWVFLMTSLGLGEHYEESLPQDLNPDYTQNTPTGTPVTPTHVTAVGGITYAGSDKAAQTMTDPTSRLWDGNPATVWVPGAQRSTQTLGFDLATAHVLTYITISPLKGTVIPHFRVSGSNDGVHWTIITDTSVRKADYPGVGNEPLAGTYRYVKVLLLNPQNVSKASYETMTNPVQGETYSVTKITDIQIYTDGEGTPTPDIPVAAPDTNQPDGDTTETQEDAVSPDTSDPDGENASEGEETTPSGEKKGCGSVLGASAAGLLAVAGAAVVLGKRKDI
jgi:hypothetical protein